MSQTTIEETEKIKTEVLTQVENFTDLCIGRITMVRPQLEKAKSTITPQVTAKAAMGDEVAAFVIAETKKVVTWCEKNIEMHEHALKYVQGVLKGIDINTAAGNIKIVEAITQSVKDLADMSNTDSLVDLK